MRAPRIADLAPRLAVLAVVAASAWTYADFLGDDVYIAPAFARGTLEGATPALVPGEPVNAVSSPAWFGLALGAVTVARAAGDPELAIAGMKLGSALATLAAGWLLAALVWSTTARAPLRWLALTLALADAWLWRWGASGMESTAALAVALGALWLRRSASPVARLWAALLPGSVGLLVRPELGLLGAILGLELVVRRLRPLRHVSARAAAASAVAAAVPVLAWAWYARVALGSVVPQTAGAKRGALGMGEALWYAAQVVLAGQGAALALAAAGVGMVLARRAAIPATAWIVGAWLGALVGFDVVGGFHPLARYLLPAAGALPLAVAALGDRVLARVRPGDRWLRLGAAAAGAAAVAIWAGVTFTRVLPSSGGEACEAYRRFVEYLDAHAEDGDRLATAEIGVLAYLGRWPLVDSCGLILPRSLWSLRDDPAALLEATRPRWSTFAAPADGARFDPVVRMRVRTTQAADPRVEERVLYRITWDSPEPPDPHRRSPADARGPPPEAGVGGAAR